MPFIFSCNKESKEVSLTRDEALKFIQENYKEEATTPILAEALWDYSSTSDDLISEAISDIKNFVDEDTDVSITPRLDNPIEIKNKKQVFVDQLKAPTKPGDEGEVYIGMNETYFAYLEKAYKDISYSLKDKVLTIVIQDGFMKFKHIYNELGHETYFMKDVNCVPNAYSKLTYQVTLNFSY